MGHKPRIGGLIMLFCGRFGIAQQSTSLQSAKGRQGASIFIFVLTGGPLAAGSDITTVMTQPSLSDDTEEILRDARVEKPSLLWRKRRRK